MEKNGSEDPPLQRQRWRRKATSTREAKNQAADSERKTRWKRGPVNWTPTSFSLPDSQSQTWTTRPWVAKSDSLILAPAKRLPFAGPPKRSGWARREAYWENGMRI